MSYEGIVEFICPNGHYWQADAMHLHHFGEKPDLICKTCGEKAKYECDVDHTNGYDPNLPYTYNGPKTEAGFVDVPCEDHYGNKYFTKLTLYQPILNQNRWRKVEGD